MRMQLTESNAVIVARHFNPSIVNPLWLVKNQLLGEADFEKGCIFTDMIAQVRTRAFILLVTPDQLQFTPLKNL